MCRVQRERTCCSERSGCILWPCQGQNGNPGYNTDPNLGNFLITNDWALHLIDFTRAFRTHKDLRVPENLTRIDQRVYDGLRALNRASLERELGPYLRNVEIDGLLARRDRILAVFKDRIAKKGEHLVICKRQGH